MVKGDHDVAASAASRLGERLRALRAEAPAHLTQRMLADVLGGSPSSVSMEENAERLPSRARLSRYAHLFCTPRSFDGKTPRLLKESELTDEERKVLQQLEQELLELREEASSEGNPFESGRPERIWYFGDGAPITIVCGDVRPDSPEQRPSYWDPKNRNYVRAASFADLDALLDLFGHLRAENPATMVRIRAGTELHREEMGGHLVLLGGIAWNAYTRWMSAELALPVRQLPERDDVFVLPPEDGPEEAFGPRFDPEGRLVEDVGLFARGPNPQDPAGTLTICSGVTTRGVRGTVLCFADPLLRELRESNQRYIAERFAGRPSYGFLVKVELLYGEPGEPSTPDLTKDDTRLLEWSDGRVEAGSARHR